MAKQSEVVEIPKEAIDTGYLIDIDLDIRGPEHDGKFWITDNYIWGPINSGKYHVDKQGNILLGADNKPTGFLIQNYRIYGPSKELPWFKI